MRGRIRFWLKITVALAIGLTVYAATPSARDSEIAFDCKAFWIDRFGTPAQLEALTDEAGRRAAAEGGYAELHEARRALRQAIDAQQRLARMDAGLADYAIRFAMAERDQRRAEIAQNDP